MIFAIDEKMRNRTALYTASREMSYGELGEAVREFGAQIEGRRLVFCLCRNTIAAVIGYLGILNQGSVPLLLDGQTEWEQLKGLYEVYQPGLLWLPEEQASRWRRELPGRVRHRDGGYVLLEPEQRGAKLEMHKDLALLLTTSGSTGSPKLVRLSRENIRSNGASIVEYLNITEGERAITTLPMHYTYGLSVLHSHLLAGAGLILTEESVVQEGFWRLLEAKGATSLAGVPYTYQLLNRLRLFEGPCGSLKTLTQAGGRLPEELQRKIGRWSREHQIRFFIMYGQTEATARMGYLPEGSCLEKVGSLGIAIPGGRFWLENEARQQIHEPDVVGELCYQGPNVSLGYARCREDLALGDERGGILATGDLARFDADGYYYIVGRRSRFVKLYGRRISLDSCEKMLAEAWERPDADGSAGNQRAETAPRQEWEPVEFVCTGDDHRIQIISTDKNAAEWAPLWLTEQLDLPRRAVESRWLGKLPRNHQGKINYSSLEAATERSTI